MHFRASLRENMKRRACTTHQTCAQPVNERHACICIKRSLKHSPLYNGLKHEAQGIYIGNLPIIRDVLAYHAGKCQIGRCHTNKQKYVT